MAHRRLSTLPHRRPRNRRVRIAPYLRILLIVGTNASENFARALERAGRSQSAFAPRRVRTRLFSNVSFGRRNTCVKTLYPHVRPYAGLRPSGNYEHGKSMWVAMWVRPPRNEESRHTFNDLLQHSGGDEG